MIFKIKITLASLITIFGFSLILVPCVSAAADPGDGTPTPTTQVDPNSCQGGNAKACLKSGSSGSIMSALSMMVSFLSAGVLLLATVMLVVAGIQYSASNGDPKGVAAAKERIVNVLIGLAAYVLLFAFLEWLIPGGIWVP